MPVDYASHSVQVEAIRDRVLADLEPIEPRRGDLPLFSSVTGGLADAESLDAAYWYENLRHTVRFDQAVDAACGQGRSTFIEVSPHPVLTASLDEALGGHGVVLGRNVLLAAQVGIAGSTVVGDSVTFGGQVGVGGHLTIGDRAKAVGQSGITNSVDADRFVSGYPAIDNGEWRRSSAVFRKLPEMRRQLRDLEARLKKLEENNE